MNPNPQTSNLDRDDHAKPAEALTTSVSRSGPAQEALSHRANREGKYLTFTLASEEYGISILSIKELIGMMPITSVPRTPNHVKGVVNLRGKVIPVIDLRLRFGMDPMGYNDRTCIVVVEIVSHSMQITIGIVVDSVSEVLNIKNDDIESTLSFGSELDTRYILGMAKVEGKVKILLDINEVLGAADLSELAQVA